MDFMEKFNISVSMLLTGFTIVFSVLIFLIFLIWAYGTLVNSVQNALRERKIRKEHEAFEKEEAERPPVEIKPVAESAPPAPVIGGVPDEIVAVISAAVYSMYGSKEKVKIKSIKRAKTRSAWANAGVLDNTRPF